MERQATDQELQRVKFYLNQGITQGGIVKKMIAAGYGEKWSWRVVENATDGAYSAGLGSIK